MVFIPPDPTRFAEAVSSWLSAGGAEDDVVVSCRVRLARNIEGFPFVSCLEPGRAQEISATLRDLMVREKLAGETIWIDMEEASPLLRLLLRERHLVSRDLAPTDPRLAKRPGRAVAFGADETLSVMVNEEDHVRLQSFTAGFALREAWKNAHQLDLILEGQVGFSHSQEFGYLTGCPTNVGTGLRASVMMHLPGLGLVRAELEKVFNAAQRTGLAVRGMYGEGSQAAGDFYQFSNQVTLGCTEEDLLEELESLVPSIVDYERRVRKVLLEEQGAALEDRIRRSFGMLRTARSLPTQVALIHLSNVRLGSCVGILESIKPRELNRMTVQIQKGHVNALGSVTPEQLAEATERDRMRATFLRKRFGEFA